MARPESASKALEVNGAALTVPLPAAAQPAPMVSAEEIAAVEVERSKRTIRGSLPRHASADMLPGMGLAGGHMPRHASTPASLCSSPMGARGGPREASSQASGLRRFETIPSDEAAWPKSLADAVATSEVLSARRPPRPLATWITTLDAVPPDQRSAASPARAPAPPPAPAPTVLRTGADTVGNGQGLRSILPGWGK